MSLFAGTAMISDNPEKSTRQSNSFSKLWKIAKIVLAIGLVLFVISNTNFKELHKLGSQIIWIWIWPYILLYVLLTFLKAFQYKKLLDIHVPLSRMVNVVVMQNGLSNIVANSAGILSYLVMLREEQGVSMGRSAMVFVVTKVGDLFSVWVAMFISSMLLWNQIPGLHSTIVVLLLVLGLPLVVFLLIVLVRQQFTSRLHIIFESIGLTRFSFVSESLLGLDTLVNEERGAFLRMTFNAVVLSAVYFVVTFVWYLIQLKIFSVNLDITPVLFVTTLLQLISILPITILGGLGVVETSSLYLYGLFGVNVVTFAAVLIGLRAMFYLINLLLLLYIPVYAFIDSRLHKSQA